jgi:ribonuclease P/MRP protein subunit RPP40
VLLWLKSFLNSRRQCVLYKGMVSEQVDVTSGVPQGSVLGPLLFTLYMLDLPACVTSPVSQYADDTTIYRSIKDVNDIITLQNDLNTISIWCMLNDMALNATKSTHLVVTRSKMLMPSTNSINEDPIPTKTNMKLLSVLISGDLKWNDHANYVCNRGYKVGIVMIFFV